MQATDGSWRLTKELASILGHDLTELNAAVQGATGPRDEVLRACATSLALAWLQKNAADAEDEWRLLATKARKWLDAAPTVPPGGGAWIDFAESFLTLHERAGRNR